MGLFSSVKKIGSSIIDAGSSFLDTSLGGFIGDAALDAGSAYAAYQASKAGAEQKQKWDKQATATAFQRSKRAYQNRYQWQMDDMRHAGLNPILAYSQGPPGGPAGQAIASSDPAQAAVGGMGALTSARAQRAAASVQKQQERQIRETTKLTRDQQTRTKWEALNLQQQRDTAAAHELNMTELNKKLRLEQQQLRQNITAGQPLAVLGEMDAAFWRTREGRALRALDRAGNAILPGTSALQRLR